MDNGQVTMRSIVGGGYDEFWRFKGRYRVVKGSRASKKSKTAALWYIAQLSKEKYREANLLVVRRTYRTLKDSCFAELKWAVRRLGLQEEWAAKESPLEMENRRTGQRIYFRGLDDPFKITSITVEQGYLCWLWIEEAYEIGSEEDFDTLDESIRGELPKPLFKQTTLTFNPWSEQHWLKARFFDKPDPDVFAMTTDYTCNEWLDDADFRMFERMKIDNPRRYRVAGLGEWGIADGLVYDNWVVSPFSVEELLHGKESGRYTCVFGLDYGYSNDPTAFIAAAVDPQDKQLFVFDEHYQTRMVNSEIARMIREKGYAKERIRADSAEPKSNEELRRLGISRVTPAEKGKDSILHGIAVLQEYRITVHPLCKETARELSLYAWEKREDGSGINRPIDRDNHLMDALRYAMTDVGRRRSRPDEQRAYAKAARRSLLPSDIAAGDLIGGWG
ncbi:MAG: PBSX family phage terminase large subunit [Clostridia bacterium]|nr:PBSX family phage terminase large subunit [Clostridia bacterium]